jgi:hypothetical protein
MAGTTHVLFIQANAIAESRTASSLLWYLHEPIYWTIGTLGRLGRRVLSTNRNQNSKSHSEGPITHQKSPKPSSHHRVTARGARVYKDPLLNPSPSLPIALSTPPVRYRTLRCDPSQGLPGASLTLSSLRWVNGNDPAEYSHSEPVTGRREPINFTITINNDLGQVLVSEPMLSARRRRLTLADTSSQRTGTVFTSGHRAIRRVDLAASTHTKKLRPTSRTQPSLPEDQRPAKHHGQRQRPHPQRRPQPSSGTAALGSRELDSRARCRQRAAALDDQDSFRKGHGAAGYDHARSQEEAQGGSGIQFRTDSTWRSLPGGVGRERGREDP